MAADRCLADGQIVVAFLCVIDERDCNSAGMKTVIGEITKAAGNSQNILVAQPLTKITRRDIDRWIRGDLPNYLRVTVPSRLTTFAANLFNGRDPQQYFLAIHDEICSELETAIPREGVFSER